MKRFLTVLLVVAVMFTFSFSGAFAMTNFSGTSYPAMEEVDYVYAGGPATHGGVKGSVGITDAERDAYVASLEDALATLEYSAEYDVDGDGAIAADLSEQFSGVHLTNVENYVKEALEAAKVVTTSYALDGIKTDLATKVVSEKHVKYLLGAIETAATADYTFTLSLEAGTYLLPGYCYFDNGATITAIDDTSVVASYTGANAFSWFIDNGYETKAKIESTAAKAAFEKALVKVSATTSKKVYDTPDASTVAAMVPVYYEWAGLVAKFNQTVVTDLDAVVDAADAIADFQTKYGTAPDATYEGAVYAASNVTSKVNAAHAYYVAKNFATEHDAVKALKSTEYVANKDKIVALAKAVAAYEDKYGVSTGYSYTAELTAIENAGDDAYAKAKVALAGRTADKLRLADKDAFDALVAAYDAYKAEFKDSIYAGLTDITANNEAFILAGKANLEYLSGDSDLDETNIQNYLNNATLKVTTKALGNKKVRVQARFDAETYKEIVNKLDKGDTISYQFYYKKAANTTYKAGKVKDVNYTTFKLAKGTKYNFQCQVVIKDAKGNVIATKDYKASNVGTRTVK